MRLLESALPRLDGFHGRDGPAQHRLISCRFNLRES